MANQELWIKGPSKVFRVGKLTAEFKKHGGVADPFTAKLFKGFYTGNKRELADKKDIFDLDFGKSKELLDKFDEAVAKKKKAQASVDPDLA